jgi:hypothetical protein
MKLVKKEYTALKKKYMEYLATYKFVNNGSLVGAIQFDEFYLYKVYTSKYADKKSLSQVVYR